MNYYVVFDVRTGRILGPASIPKPHTLPGVQMLSVTATEHRTATALCRVDLSTRKLVAGALPDPNPPSMSEIRNQRDMLLQGAGQQLTEALLPDSFPALSSAEKQAKVDGLVTYRKALRDITQQQDPSKIIWPEMPL